MCGILSDVYLSRFRNVRGQRFGFAKFSKVRDVEKLKKALNNVVFWDLRLFANVAKFDRFIEKNRGSAGGEERNGGKRVEGENNRGNKEGKNSREMEGKVDERGDSRKLVLEKVKVAAIHCELEREREKVFTVGKVECGDFKGAKMGKEEGTKMKDVELKEEGRPKSVVGEGMESVCGNV